MTSVIFIHDAGSVLYTGMPPGTVSGSLINGDKVLFRRNNSKLSIWGRWEFGESVILLIRDHIPFL